MTTKRNMANKMFMNILATGITATALTACKDELKVETFNATSTETFAFTNLEQYSYTAPVKVDVEGDWKVDLKFADADHMFCYAYPDHGHGPATIQLCMLDNWTNERNAGEMTIVDLNNPKNNKVYPLNQKCNLDYRSFTRGEENFTAMNTMAKAGARNFGVGYGYNVTAQPGNGAVSLNPIIKLEALKAFKDGGVSISSNAKFNVDQFSGRSIVELANKVSFSSNIKGSYNGFKAEVDASFSKSQTEKRYNMFVLGVVDVKVREAYLEGLDLNNVRDFMTDAAKRAIDGTGRAYPSTAEGFKELISAYGSHLIMKASLGGRLRYATSYDEHVCTSESEAKAMATCSYKNTIADAGCKASAEQKQKYEKNQSFINTTISAMGGSSTTIANFYTKNGDSEENVREWIKSLNDDNNLAVVGISQKNGIEIIPLYELVDATAYPERYNALKEYMQTGMMEDDAQNGTEAYTTGDITMISIPEADELVSTYGMADQNRPATLVYEVWNQDKRMVAMLCNEYIPQISTHQTVQTIYLVENNKPNFRVGRFLGDASHPACDIVWNDNGQVECSNYASSKGKQNTIYLRGSKFFTSWQSTLDKSDIIGTTIKGKFMNGQKAKSNVNVTFGGRSHSFWSGLTYDNADLKGLSYEKYQYPLVKMGNRIWTRQNYDGNVPHGTDWKNRYGSKIADGRAYFTPTSIGEATFPVGWHAARSIDYRHLKNVISQELLNKTYGACMQKGGVSGFEMEWNGWWTFELAKVKNTYNYYYLNYEQHAFNAHQMEYMTPDGYHIRIKDDAFDIVKETSDWAMQIRLVMD